jgi:hypothetical protein
VKKRLHVNHTCAALEALRRKYEAVSMVRSVKVVLFNLNCSTSSTGHWRRLLSVFISNNTVRGIDCIMKGAY